MALDTGKLRIRKFELHGLGSYRLAADQALFIRVVCGSSSVCQHILYIFGKRHLRNCLKQRCEHSTLFHVRCISSLATYISKTMADELTPHKDDVLKVPVYAEELSVDVVTSDTGRGLRVSKTVHAHPVVVDQPLMHDHVDVHRVSVDRMLESGEALPATRYEGDVLIVPVLEEVLVVEKRMKLKEELHITRSRSEEFHSQTVILKEEHVSIERFDESNL